MHPYIELCTTLQALVYVLFDQSITSCIAHLINLNPLNHIILQCPLAKIHSHGLHQTCYTIDQNPTYTVVVLKRLLTSPSWNYLFVSTLLGHHCRRIRIDWCLVRADMIVTSCESISASFIAHWIACAWQEEGQMSRKSTADTLAVPRFRQVRPRFERPRTDSVSIGPPKRPLTMGKSLLQLIMNHMMGTDGSWRIVRFPYHAGNSVLILIPVI